MTGPAIRFVLIGAAVAIVAAGVTLPLALTVSTFHAHDRQWAIVVFLISPESSTDATAVCSDILHQGFPTRVI